MHLHTHIYPWRLEYPFKSTDLWGEVRFLTLE